MTTGGSNSEPRGPWQFEEPPCDFCGAAEADVLYEGRDRLHGLPGKFCVVVCRSCGLARTSPRPTLESLGTAYPVGYEPHQGGHVCGEPPTGLLRRALIDRKGYPLGKPSSALVRGLCWPAEAVVLGGRRALGYLPYTGQGRLLDFGCGAGGYVARMNAAGWRAEGLDLNPEVVATGRAAGLTIHQGTLPGAELAPGSFDAVTMWHALEHVPSPQATLTAAAKLLTRGGRLLVAVPRLDSLPARMLGSAWYGLDLPRHLTHFTATTLCRSVEKVGFRVERLYHVRRPGFLRHSYAQLAEETGRGVHRRLARSRVLVGLLTHVALMLRRTQQMVCLARLD